MALLVAGVDRCVKVAIETVRCEPACADSRRDFAAVQSRTFDGDGFAARSPADGLVTLKKSSPAAVISSPEAPRRVLRRERKAGPLVMAIHIFPVHRS